MLCMKFRRFVTLLLEACLALLKSCLESDQVLVSGKVVSQKALKSCIVFVWHSLIKKLFFLIPQTHFQLHILQIK